MRMSRVAVTVAIGAAVAMVAAVEGQRAGGTGRPRLTLTSPAFPDGGDIPPRFTQAVPNFVSPALEWVNVPEGTVGFVLLFRDPDVALQRKVEDSLHWLLFNIPGSARGLPEGIAAVPRLADGTVQAKNRRGIVGYLGPGAPPPGPQHHYTFELFAVDIKLDLDPEATRAQVLAAIDGHVVGKAVLMGRFHL
jgi:Raf kinase inhibitor-like YbhB/YbcL family protein